MECPSCEQRSWIEFDLGCYCENCQYNISIQKQQLDKKVLRQNIFFLKDYHMLKKD